MITKALVQSVNATGDRCIVRIPLFETSASSNPVLVEALVNIAPGIFNGLVAGDVVFIAFEENAMEKPVILGKLFRGATTEGNIRGGGAVLNSLKVNSDAVLPAATSFTFPQNTQNDYKYLNTPKKIADYIKWLEKLVKQLATQQEEHFRCFKNWTQWQLKAENVEIDDGDLDANTIEATLFQYQEEGKVCHICNELCTKKNKRSYLPLATDKNYPQT